MRRRAAGLVAMLVAVQAAAQKTDVVHFYTSSGESLAIGIFNLQDDRRAHDVKAAASDGVGRTFETMGKLQQYVDAGNPNRKWNDTLALVETNEAALMIVGDWAKGDLAAANLKIDQDWGYALAPGTQDAYIMQSNSFAFPKTDKADQIAAQRNGGSVHGSRDPNRICAV
jgi:hypothetical protein